VGDSLGAERGGQLAPQHPRQAASHAVRARARALTGTRHSPTASKPQAETHLASIFNLPWRQKAMAGVVVDVHGQAKSSMHVDPCARCLHSGMRVSGSCRVAMSTLERQQSSAHVASLSKSFSLLLALSCRRRLSCVQWSLSRRDQSDRGESHKQQPQY
jgi:hypothetical protein